MQTGSPAGGSRPPVALTSLVGRAGAIAELRTLISSQRLVTLTGVGGSGKTRVAAEVALRTDAKEVVWIDLAGCADPALVPNEIAAALSMRGPRFGDLPDAIAEAARDRDLLMVFDNCEHLVDACATLARSLLVRCPLLRILATSREPLAIPGERVWPLPPIAVDDAVRLFADRASAIEPGFVLTDDNRTPIAEVCRRLDLIPLAIELAAARIRVLTPGQIASRIEDRFEVLTGARGGDPRHRTLRAAIDWSYALLSAEEQRLLARLSVFAGSFTLEAAEEACDATLDAMTGLVDKSLVVVSQHRATARYHLLETIRDYASERLVAAGEVDHVRRRHALAYLTIMRETPIDPMHSIMTRLEALDAEHDNVRAALAWSLEHEPDAIALPITAAFRWYWYYRIQWSEGLQWTSRALDRSSPARSRERAATLSAAGTFAGYTGNVGDARLWLEEAESLWRVLGDERELALTLSALAQQLANCGELDAAWTRAIESVDLARRTGTPWDIAYCLTNAKAFVAQRRDELEEADHALGEAQDMWSRDKHPLGLPFVLSTRAVLAVRRRDDAAARALARAALVEAAAVGELWFCARSLRVLSVASIDDPQRAARLLGAGDRMLRQICAGILLHERASHQRVMEALRESMTERELDTALREGAAMSFEEILAVALSEDESTEARPDAVLRIADLGPLAIELRGNAVVAEGRASSRARELLAFLAAHPEGVTRNEAGVAFWPDASEESVKNSFHVTLHRLRKLLGDSKAITSVGGRYTIALPFIADSTRFEKAMTSALRKSPADIATLETAIALYRGDYLYGENAGEWADPVRSRLRQLLIRALFALGSATEARGRLDDAAEAYSRVLARDPFHEAAARQLMICRARLGLRSESLLVYRQLEDRLRDDLQAAPEPETATLYRRLRQNEAV